MKKNVIKLSNNEEIHYQDYGTSSDVLVLIHGNMSSGVHYQPIIDDLLEKYRVIIPDMRGFGDSTYNTPINSLEDLGKDIIEIMDSLNINSYFLAGWSTGGGIALKIASLVPTRVRKIILIESCSYRGYPIFQKDQNNQPLLGVHYQTKEEMAKDPVQVLPMVQIFETKNKPFINAVWDQLIYTVNKPTKEENDLFLDETLKQRNLVDIDWALVTFNMSDTFNGVAEGDQSIKDVTCPVLSIWSEKDVVVLEYMIDETVAALKDCKKVVLKDSGHSPLVDKPKELTNLIIDFL